MDYLVAPSPEFMNRPTGTIAPTILSRRINAQHKTRSGSANVVPVPADSPRQFAIEGFIPLPSISASPVCTPSAPQDLPSDEFVNCPEEFITAPNSPSSPLSHGVSIPPTWISTPPTPPPKMVRRSVTCSTRPTSQISQSASFPASNLSHEVGSPMKRCKSVPSPLQRSPSNQSPSPCEKDAIMASYDATIRPSTTKRFMTNQSKHLFHISSDALTDTEDYSPRMTESPEHLHEDLSVEGSWSDVESDESRQFEKAKDDLRKYHALKELLDTEIGYLLDLRALVTVYLRILPTLQFRLTPPPTAFTSFTSSPWINSHTYMHVAALSSSATVSDSSTLLSHGSSQAKDSAARYLLSNQEVEVLMRNAEEILQLHEQFVRELRGELAPFGFHIDAYQRMGDSEKTHNLALCNTDVAIRVVSTKFATEAARFTSYQSFCAGHLEALNVLKKVATQHPLEWGAFEQRCSSLISELELSTRAIPESEQALVDESENVPAIVMNHDRGRATSMSSVEGTVHTLRSRTSNLLVKDGTVLHIESVRKEKPAPRLAFADYLIKPVQRICRYPLILDQLKPRKSVLALFPAHLRSDVDVIVENAAQAMRHVTSSVDEARHRQDVAIQSALIASRMTLVSSIMTQMISQYPAFQSLTRSFLSSLGTCILAGSLDVIYYETAKPPTSSVSAKYSGAFLYPGGYLILVKVSKGKAYEPRHWFSLADFDIYDVEETDAMLPCSIRLTSKDHHFELAAACQREKDVWLDSLQESRLHQASWINEPTSSLLFDGKGELIHLVSEDGTCELNTLPTIQSNPEKFDQSPESSGLGESPISNPGSDLKLKRSSRQEPTSRIELDLPSRRSSVASGKGIFSPISSDSETIVIRRYSASARSRVDQGLQDVISQLFLTARSYASIRDELFQVPKAAKSGFVRSQSGLSMAGMAKNRLIRHESVRVPRHKSMIERPGVPPSIKLSSLTSKRQSKALSLTTFSKPEHRATISAHPPSPPSSYSFTTTTQSLLRSSDSRHSLLGSHTPSKPPVIPVLDTKSPMKTSRSLVNGVKEFFQSRSPSIVSLGHAQSPDIENHEYRRSTPSTIRRWAKGSFHRRTRSAPNAPEELLILPNIQKLPPLDMSAVDVGTVMPSSSPGSHCPLQDVGRLSADKSLWPQSFISPGRCHAIVGTEPHHGPTEPLPILRHLKA